MTDRYDQVGWLGDDSGVSFPLPDQSFGPQAGILLVGNACNDQAPGLDAAGRGQPGSRSNHGGNPALHILRAAAVNSAVTLHRVERPTHARDTHSVQVAAEHQGWPWPGTLHNPNDVRTARRGLSDLKGQPNSSHSMSRSVSYCSLTLSAGNKRWIDGIDGDQVAQ